MPKRVPFELPNEQCERLTRSEMALCRMILALASEINYAKDDLKKRLECVPSGVQRLNMLTGAANSLLQDLLGTVSDRQRKQLKNTALDYNVTLKPKMDFSKGKILMSEEEFRELTDCAQEKCSMCAETGEGARKCKLYQWLEANVPLDDYGDGLMCPYANIGWKK